MTPAAGPSIRLLSTLLAVGLALTAEQLIRAHPNATSGWLLLGCAAGLIAAAAPGTPETVEQSGSSTAPSRPTWWKRLPWALTTLLAVGGATALSTADRWPVLVLALWILSFLVGSLALRRWHISPPLRLATAWTSTEILGLGGIVVLALVARIAWPDAVPPYYFPDEGRVGLFLREHYADRIPNPFTMGWNTWPLIGLSAQGMFGPFIGLSTTSLRYASAVMGTLGVLCTYLLARQLLNPRVALISAFLLAICRTAIDFSRLGTCHAQVMFLAPLAFYFWWRAINTGWATSYFWTGIALGLCLYTYNAGQLLPVLWLSWVVLCFVCAQRRTAVYWTGALVTIVAFVITVFPYAFYFTDHFHFGQNWGQWTIMARHRQTMDDVLGLWRSSGARMALSRLEQAAWTTWLGFNILPAGAYGLGYRGGGMLDGVTAPLFMLGLAVCVTHVLQPRLVFVAYWWLITAVFGGVLTIDPPAFVRMVGILPPLALLAAVPLDVVFRAVGTGTRRAMATVVVVTMLVVATWINWRTYFVEFAQQPSDQVTTVGRALRRLPADGTAFLLGSEYEEVGPVPHSQLFFIQEYFLLNFPGRNFQDVADPAALLPFHEPMPSAVTLFLGPSQVTLASYIHRLYPGAVIEDYQPSNGPLLFRTVELSHDDLIGQAGLQRTPYANDVAQLPTIANPFASVPSPPTGDHLKWTGSIYWPSDRPVTVAALNSQRTTVRIAETAPVLLQPGVETRTPLQLPRGWHPIEIDEDGGSPGGLALSIDDGGARPFTRWDLRPEASAQGLIAVYEVTGKPSLRTIDPQIDAFAIEGFFRPPNHPLEFASPFNVTWEGSLRIDQAGTYTLDARGSGPFSLLLDGVTIFDERSSTPTSPRPVAVSCRLAAGSHALTAHWTATQAPYNTLRRMFQLYWTPPGGMRELIPPPAFSPRQPESPVAEPASCTRTAPTA